MRWFVVLMFLISAMAHAQGASVKLEPCKISWKAVTDADLAKYRIDIVEGNDVVDSREFPSSTTEVACKDLLNEGQSRKLNFYAIDTSNNVSNGLMGLEIQIVDSSPPSSIEEACVEGVDTEDKPVKVCIPAQQSTTFQWTPPTTNDDGTPLTNLEGYKLYSGPRTRNYSGYIDVGNVTTYSVVVDDVAKQRYFAVTAYNSKDKESDYSNEVRLSNGITPTKISFYVAYDARANPYPEWLRDDYLNLEKTLITSDAMYRLWGGADNNGAVSIPGNMYGSPQKADSNYFVLFDGEITDLKPEIYQISSLTVGVKPYIDRNYKVTLVPDGFKDYKIIQTKNSDKRISTASHMTFNFIH